MRIFNNCGTSDTGERFTPSSHQVLQTNEIADTDDADTDDSDLIYFGKSRCGTDIKIKIVGKCLMDKKKVVSLLNGYI